MAGKNGSKRTKKREAPELMITSLLDAFTILLLYLIKNFSADGESITVSPDLILPESSAQKDAKAPKVAISVSKNEISMDGKVIITIEDVNDYDALVIPPLQDQLEISKEEEKQMVRLGAALKFEGKVMLQIDKKVPFKIMYKVMATCGQVGYTKMDMAVIRQEG